MGECHHRALAFQGVSCRSHTVEFTPGHQVNLHTHVCPGAPGPPGSLAQSLGTRLLAQDSPQSKKINFLFLFFPIYLVFITLGLLGLLGFWESAPQAARRDYCRG